MRTLTLKQVGYLITGTVTLNLWGGDNGNIEMKPVEIEKLNTANVLSAINDNGFGCESYNNACISIYRLFEDGVTRHYIDVDFSADDLWGCTNINCDFSKLAKEYENKYSPIIDKE